MNRDITERQLEIINAAGKILTASGVGGLTIKNIANEMNFSESAIYRHFKSKESIIVGMLEYLADSMDKRNSIKLNNLKSAEEKFISLFKGQFSFFNENPHFVVAVFSDGLMEESDLVNETILRIMAVKIKYLMPIIEEGQLDGDFTCALSTADLMHIVMGAFRLQMYKWRMAHFNYDIIIEGDRLIMNLLSLIQIDK